MFLYNAKQIAAWDAFTIQNKPISSIDLMECAATAAFHIIQQQLNNNNWVEPIIVFCGNGNNGGDGLVIARLLHQAKFKVVVCALHANQYSPDYLVNLQRATDVGVNIVTIQNLADIQAFYNEYDSFTAIDALFGTGLNKPLTGLALALVQHINQHAAYVFAIDIPSGLFADFDHFDASNNFGIVKANTTLTFQIPKQSFMLADAYPFVGDFKVVDIGLLKDYSLQNTSLFCYIEPTVVADFIRPRKKFSHKGSYGHALLVGGSYGKCGAMVLATKAALKTGCGLATAFVPKVGNYILQTGLPEAMVETSFDEHFIADFNYTVNANAIGIGMGMGTAEVTQTAFYNWLKQVDKPLLLDADAINCCALLMQQYPHDFKYPHQCILTPHPKEFDRLVGSSQNALERLNKQIAFSKTHQVVVVLKGAHTSITIPDGRVYFNSSGNAMLATAGSGDVLSGIITSFLAQGLSAEQAAITGVYLHGLCADLAEQNNLATMLAGDICHFIPMALKKLLSNITC